MVTMRGGRLALLAALAMLLACREDVPLPTVTAPLDASSRPDGRGRPSEEIDAGAVDSGPAGAESDAGSCNGGVRQVSLRQFNAQVILAVDRSASMADKPAGSAISRWQMVQNALRPLMRTYHQAVYFGHVEFPTLECRREGGCCSGAFLPPSPSFGAIERKWNCGQTVCPVRPADAPLGQALAECRRHFESAEQSSGSRHVLVITDGEPSCGGAAGMAATCSEASKEVAEMVGQRIRTTVFALDPALKTSACLGDLTDLGSGGQLYLAADEAAMTAQLDSFLAPLSEEACTFRLREALVPPERLALRINGNSLSRDPTRTEGWDFDAADDMALFTVYGSWCDKIRESEVHDVDAFVCSR